MQSVFDQCYTNWELCLPTNLAEADAIPRTRIVKDRTEATGDYLITLHAGDRLSPHALYFYAQALEDILPQSSILDEDCITGDGIRTDPIFKPGWSPELLCSTMYLGRESSVIRVTQALACLRHLTSATSQKFSIIDPPPLL